MVLAKVNDRVDFLIIYCSHNVQDLVVRNLEMEKSIIVEVVIKSKI